jgi:DNA-binding transcriptional regulator YiaG
MTPEEFKEARNRFGLSQNDIARIFDLGSDRIVRRWEEGEKELPGSVKLLMEIVVNFPSVRRWLGIDIDGEQD